MLRQPIVACALLPLMLSTPVSSAGQAVISDDGFASVAWYSGAEEIHDVWGKPLRVERVPEPPLDLLIYRGLPIDHELTFTVFVVHPEQGLLTGDLMVFVADSATAAGKLSQWKEMVSSVRGDPVCAFGEGVLSRDQVNMQAQWCSVENMGCECWDAGTDVVLVARYSDYKGFGFVALSSSSKVQREHPVSYIPVMSEALRGLVEQDKQ